ncbi:Putative flavin monooxygenase, FAD/NAD(P)-binding domain superfamily [Septoria linicola]|uniref:Flavin monooxygenase, FAD/NAD(P)-binding domain superfamily n=1 Tax=Septoria linicola TaxID=215465 RepID=A0A9Q9AH33_9PEZI|nr:putative flavin monooxygenase, FAD/NAD(P)-binding domain superfamily [Septoria linicola]USW49057.1 Putative flavin monooxygenase, FAD/NAD(P)-binding domain superfamily [Septoria linicola]
MQRTFKAHAQGTNGHTDGTNGSGPQALELDALIIGGGFAGVYLLHLLRQSGFNVKIIEAGSALGGIWHWNNYPGARVDSQWPVYQLAIPEVFNTFEWKEHYPGASELQRYFQHADKVLDISKDTIYNTRVEQAIWDDEAKKWNITCDTGLKVRTPFLNCCLGFAAKRHFPDWAGLDNFAGYICHSSFWPKEGVDMRGKRVACVGSGATGIQIAQESAKQAEHLTVFVRTPNTCIPMNQAPVDPEKAKGQLIEILPRRLKERYRTVGGFLYDDPTKSVMGTPKEERDAILEAAWKAGGFTILFTFADVQTDITANRYMYDFWASKVRARISDPEKRDILAPLEPPHPFGGKRPSLEQDYYEQLDKDHVTVVDLKKTPIERVVPEGIVTSDGKLHELDIIAMATGFDSLTGSFTQIDIQGINGRSLKEYWSGDQGALSYLGLAVNDFPNMFYTYGPHAPTAYGNGPSIVEPQCEWILESMKRMTANGQTKINAQAQAEQEWKQTVNKLHAGTFRDQVDSWYMGSNIPGKPRQALNYAGGLPLYIDTINEKLEKNWEGFDVS